MKNYIELNRDSYLDALVGKAPADFPETIKKAVRVCELMEADGLSPHEDVLLVAAAGANADKWKRNPIAFVQRAKQLVKFLFGVQEGRRRYGADELAGARKQGDRSWRVSSHAGSFKNEGFVLMLFNHQGVGGHTTYVSTVDRRTQIKLFEEHVRELRRRRNAHS